MNNPLNNGLQLPFRKITRSNRIGRPMGTMIPRE